MRIVSSLFLVLSLLTIGYAGVRWAQTERTVHQEEAAQVSLASTAVDLATSSSGWTATRFAPVRSGSHGVILETKSGTVERSTPLSFHGTIEVQVEAPDGRLAFHSPTRRISHTLATGLTWTLLGDFPAQTGPGDWTLRVRMEKGDPSFAQTVSRVYVRTPAKFDARWFELRRRVSVALIATGGVVLLLVSGFFYLMAKRR